MTDRILETVDERQTEAAGEQLAATLGPSSVVLLYGPLGAGKTAFVRGMARGLGAPPADVSSPTFTLVQEYAGGRLTLYHVDLYRLRPEEVDDLGLDELMAGGGVAAIEWADRWSDRPGGAIEVVIEDIGADRRRLTVRGADALSPGV